MYSSLDSSLVAFNNSLTTTTTSLTKDVLSASFAEHVDTYFNSFGGSLSSISQVIDYQGAKLNEATSSLNNLTSSVASAVNDTVSNFYFTLSSYHSQQNKENIDAIHNIITSNDFLISLSKVYESKRPFFDEDMTVKIIQQLNALQSVPSVENAVSAEFKIGDKVTVTGRAGIYTVTKSYSVLFNDSQYTIIYMLVSDDKVVLVPESMLTLS